MGQMTGSYLWPREDVLAQYALPYDPLRPLICCDERPCFLIGEVGGLLPMSPGKARRHHYAYEKHGSCCVLLAFEPHTGLRYVEVRPQRTAVDSAPCMQNLIEQHYPAVEQSALRADFSTAASLSGTSALGSYGIRAAFDYFPLVIDHPVGRVPDTPYAHLMPTVRTDQWVPPRALLIPLPIG